MGVEGVSRENSPDGKRLKKKNGFKGSCKKKGGGGIRGQSLSCAAGGGWTGNSEQRTFSWEKKKKGGGINGEDLIERENVNC